MNLDQLETDIQSLVTEGKKSSFIYDLLLAYEVPRASLTRLKKGDYNLSRVSGEVLWKKKVCFKRETEVDLYGCIDKLKNDPVVTKQRPRFIVVTDFTTLLAVDTTTGDTLDTPFLELAKHFDFFLPWAGMEKSQLQSENPADIRAAERMGRLYDLVLRENPPETAADRHALNVFLARLLFCFFAEDTDIFAPHQFTNAVASHTDADGSDLQAYLQKLFKVLSTDERSDFPNFLQEFPYVNGGLFKDEHPVPSFSVKSRKIIIECGALNWKAINPDIFGSMIQAVIHPDQRGGLGIHYTSVVNIMKVIEPLFLDDLNEELEKVGGNKKKLTSLLQRLYRFRVFDPACGSGNFLIIAYKELCKLEIEIFKRIHGKQTSFRFESKIQLAQFYGIELDDFAHETAKLSLWLAEHQMNLAFKVVFGTTRPTLPLQDGGNIICGNATREDWEGICSKTNTLETYILGNPPYQGFAYQNKFQKDDLKKVWGAPTKLDYISCWFYLAAQYITGNNASFAFLSTNSICQGEQVSLLWPNILKGRVEITFCHTSFKWSNNAKGNAGVTCVVIGIANATNTEKTIYTNGVSRKVNYIGPYLTPLKSPIVSKRSKPLSKLTPMTLGDMAKDGGHLFLSTIEKTALLEEFPYAEKFIRKMVGAQEFIRGGDRWCIWIDETNVSEACAISAIDKRVKNVITARLKSKKKATQEYAKLPYRFVEIRKQEVPSIFVPTVSSQRRNYIPIGFIESSDIITAPNQVIYDPSRFIFAVLSSRMHMTWVRTVAGRLKTDYRYSSALCYNTFPFPEISEAQEVALEAHGFNVLDERERHPEKTMADLYDPDTMPESLLRVHHDLDLAIEQCYRTRPFQSDEDRLEYLFKLYTEFIAVDKQSEMAYA